MWDNMTRDPSQPGEPFMGEQAFMVPEFTNDFGIQQWYLGS
jgi:hypothetical protein